MRSEELQVRTNLYVRVLESEFRFNSLPIVADISGHMLGCRQNSIALAFTKELSRIIKTIVKYRVESQRYGGLQNG